MNEQREAHEHLESSTILAAGVDEVGVVPWPTLLAHRMARRVGITRSWATLIVVLTCLFTVSFPMTLLVVSLDTISKDLNTTAVTLSWVITAPMLAFGVVGPAYGKAGDLWGHKRIFVLGMTFATLFSFLTVVAWNAWSLILFRTLSATAGAATGPSAMAYINRLFGPNERVKPLSYWSFATTMAPVVGVVLGGPLVDSVGWRVIFLVQSPLLIIGTLVSFKLLPETPRAAVVKFDIKGSLTLGLGAMLILLAINRGNGWGWTSPGILLGFALGVFSLFMFARVESRAESPLLPIHWLRKRNLMCAMGAQTFSNYAYMGGFVLIPQMLGQSGVGMTAAHISLLVISRPLSFGVTAPLMSRVTMRIGERISGMIGISCVALSLTWMAFIDKGVADWYVIVGLMLTGIGTGISSPALTSLVANSVDDDDLGVAGALQQLIVQIGAVLGSTAMIAIHESTLSHGAIPSYAYALASGAVAAMIGVGIASFTRPTPFSERQPGHEDR
jgi:MFS family permease